MLLLCVDADVMPVKSEADKADTSLVQLVSRVTDVINSVPSRPYMSPVKAEKAVEILLGLLMEMSSKQGVYNFKFKHVIHRNHCYR